LRTVGEHVNRADKYAIVARPRRPSCLVASLGRAHRACAARAPLADAGARRGSGAPRAYRCRRTPRRHTPDLLTSIVWIESRGWSWALNINGVGLYPRTRAEAEWILGRVGDDVDIGYAQVSYRHWGRALGLRKADLLEPWTNLVVGALILRQSMDQEAGWAGVGRYHSAIPHRKLLYAYRVAETLSMIRASRRLAAFDTVVRAGAAGR
jgi:hypothetical protein